MVFVVVVNDDDAFETNSTEMKDQFSLKETKNKYSSNCLEPAASIGHGCSYSEQVLKGFRLGIQLCHLPEY